MEGRRNRGRRNRSKQASSTERPSSDVSNRETFGITPLCLRDMFLWTAARLSSQPFGLVAMLTRKSELILRWM